MTAISPAQVPGISPAELDAMLTAAASLDDTQDLGTLAGQMRALTQPAAAPAAGAGRDMYWKSQATGNHLMHP